MNAIKMTPKLELLKIKIEKEKLLEVPAPERAFYLKAMNFSTDVSILQKSCWHTIPKEDDANSIKQEAVVMQAMFYLRHLAGLLFEGYELIRTGFWPNRLGQTYQIKELEKIKDYFSDGNNLIQNIRNKFAYHLDVNAVADEIEKFPTNRELIIYFSLEMSNSLYKAGDDILQSALIGVANKDLRGMLLEVLLMATDMQTFFGEFIVIFHEKHLGFEPKEKITLDVPKLSEVNIPYFVPRQ